MGFAMERDEESDSKQGRLSHSLKPSLEPVWPWTQAPNAVKARALQDQLR